MASVFLNAAQTGGVVIAGEGDQRQVRGSRDGAVFQAPWIQGLVLEGRCYMIQVGALTTPIVGGGNGTIIDLDQPEVNIGVPSGTTILPFRVNVECESSATEADDDIGEIVVGFDRLATNTGGTFTDEVAVNLRTDNPNSSLTDPNSAYTGNQTTEPTVIELVRVQRQPIVDASSTARADTTIHLLYEPLYPMALVGPAQFLVYWGGVAARSGFAQVFWAELPTLSRISG